VPTDRLGEKDVTIGQTLASAVSADVKFQGMLVNMLSTLQADKIEMISSLKESVNELERSVKGMRIERNN
jgi:GTP cyclohydrolase II